MSKRAACLLSVIASVVLLAWMLFACTTPSHVSSGPLSDQATENVPQQDDPFNGNFLGPEHVELNQPVSITFTVDPQIDILNVTMQLFLPPDVQLVEGSLRWHGDLRSGQKISLDVVVKAIDEIEQNIKAEASTNMNGVTVSRSHYFSVSTVEKVVAPTGVSPYPTAKSLGLDSGQEDAVLPNAGTITVMGTWQYWDDEYSICRPMRHAYVELYDNDWAGPELIAYTYANDNGEYLFQNISNDDGPLQGGLDVFVVVWADNAVAATVGFAGSYEYASGLYGCSTVENSNTPDGTVVNLGTLYPLQYNEAWQAIDAVLTEYRWIYSQVGWYRAPVLIKWPYGDWPRFRAMEESIELPDKVDPGWDRTTVFHECGHAVMWEAYGYSYPPSSWIGVSHSIDSETDMGLAIIEGWAEFMQCAVENDPDNVSQYSHTFGENLEINDWFNYEDSGDLDGDVVEGSVASILWDIFDSRPSDDDSLALGFDEIWTIFLNDHPASIHDFWDRWNTRYGPSTALWQVFHNYGVDVAMQPTIAYSPSNFSFTATQGGANPSNQALGIHNSGGGGLNWAVSDNAPWLTLSPTSGSSTGETDNATLSVNISGLTAGTYTATITVSATGATNTPRTVPVSLTINPGSPTIGYTPASFSFSATQGGSNPPSQTLNVQNSGGGTLNWSLSDNAAWLTLTPASGSSTGEIDAVTLSTNISGMGAGSYNATITISATGATNTPRTVSVNLTISAPTGAQAARTLPAGVDPNDEVQVEIQATGYGLAGQVVETLPAGFVYVSSSLDPSQVQVNGQNVAFTLIGETSLTYNVAASATPGTYTFAGTLRDFNLVDYTVGGDTQVMVGWSPCTYDSPGLGGNGNGFIDKAEAIRAATEYFSLAITKAQVIQVLSCYFGHTPC